LHEQSALQVALKTSILFPLHENGAHELRIHNTLFYALGSPNIHFNKYDKKIFGTTLHVDEYKRTTGIKHYITLSKIDTNDL